MRVVICKHPGCCTPYLFKVPEMTYLDAGEYVMVDTKYGEQLAQTVSECFTADPEVICPLWNTSEKKMKRVTKSFLGVPVVWAEESKDEPVVEEAAKDKSATNTSEVKVVLYESERT